MAELIDKRVIVIELDVAGGKKRYGDPDDPTAMLSVDYTITKTSGAAMNEAEVKIANLVKIDRDDILTSTSPFARPRARKTLTVYAGYESAGVTRRFVGDIVSSSVSQPPDVWLTLKARTGHHAKGDICARAASARKSTREIAADVAADLNLKLDFQAADRTVSNYAFVGAAFNQVRKLCDFGQVDAYVDDDRLVVTEQGRPLAGKLRTLSKESGMIGIPEVTEKGVKVKMLMDPHTTVGSLIEIESEINPAANGRYTVYRLTETASLRSTPFYLEVEGTRAGLGGYPK